MLRRKKLLKLRLKRSQSTQIPQERAVKSVGAIFDRCSAAMERRRNSPTYNEEWRKQYLAELNPPAMHQSQIESIAGIGAKKSVFDSKWKRPYQDNEELAERERKAIEEANEKAKMVAPAYSKGAYQYVGNMSPEDIKTLGKKV